MRSGSPLEWAQLLGVGPDDLPARTSLLLRGVETLDQTVIQLRLMLHDCPDRDLDEALMQLERRVRDVVVIVRDLHRDVLRDLA